MSDIIAVGLPDPSPYLLDEERVALVIRRHHPIVLLPIATLTLVVILIVLWFLLTDDPTGATFLGGLLIIAAAAMFFLYRWIHWSRTVLVVTNRRLFEYVSLGIKRVTVLPVVRQSIVFRQSPVGRAMGFGRVQVKTPNGAVLHDFMWLGEPARFRDVVTNIAA